MFKWINAVSYTAMVVVNALAMFGKIGGTTTSGISALYSNLLTPAGWTFMIWSAIYGLLLIFIIGPFAKPEGTAAMLSEKLGGWFALSCLMNILWLVMWHSKMAIASWVVMIGLFMTLYVMFNKITNGTSLISADVSPIGLEFASSGLSMYFGWICVAMLANTMAMLVDIGMDGYGVAANILTIVMLAIGAVVIAMISLYSGNWVLTITGMWAYAGILYRHMAPGELKGQYLGIIVTGIVGMVLMAGGLSLAYMSGNKVNSGAEAQ